MLSETKLRDRQHKFFHNREFNEKSLVPVHVDDGGCDCDAHTQGSRQQAAHSTQLNLRKKTTSVFLHYRLQLEYSCAYHRVHIFTRDETGSVDLPTQLEGTLQLYWRW